MFSAIKKKAKMGRQDSKRKDQYMITIPSTRTRDRNENPDIDSNSAIEGMPAVLTFEINIQFGDRIWRVNKTITDFFDLNGFLSSTKGAPAYDATPRSRREREDDYSTSDQMEAPFVRNMRLCFQRWLRAVVHDNALVNDASVVEFLELDSHTTGTGPDSMPSPAGSQRGERSLSRAKPQLDDFELLKVLGKGSFGKVYLVRHSQEHTGRIYAMKTLKKQRVFHRQQVEHTKTERRVLGFLKHPFLVSLHYAFQTDKKLFLVLDYCCGGELFFHLSKAGRFNEERTRYYAAEVTLALEHLHTFNIIYRDLKPENILLDGDGHIKLTDFGLCKENIPDNESAHSFCGTPEYLAPEVLKRVGHGKAADWWSLGALIYEMLSGMPPFYSRDRDQLFEKILHQQIRFPSYFSREAVQIIKDLMQRNPRRRLGSNDDAIEIKRHIFYRQAGSSGNPNSATIEGGENEEWFERIGRREIPPPFKPKLAQDKNGVQGTANFDPEFTGMPLHSPDASKRKFPPFEDFTYYGHRDEDQDLLME